MKKIAPAGIVLFIFMMLVSMVWVFLYKDPTVQAIKIGNPHITCTDAVWLSKNYYIMLQDAQKLLSAYKVSDLNGEIVNQIAAELESKHPKVKKDIANWIAKVNRALDAKYPDNKTVHELIHKEVQYLYTNILNGVTGEESIDKMLENVNLKYCPAKKIK